MRYRAGLTVAKVFPVRLDGRCARCESPLGGKRRRWCSHECERAAVSHFRILKGDVFEIRRLLLRRDHGVCAMCQEPQSYWEADHIVAVVNGGGGCGLEGYQTLCVGCHRAKTQLDLGR